MTEMLIEDNSREIHQIHDLYDRMFKRILTLSDKTVINLINGLFYTEYPENSTITYNWTEHVDKNAKRTLADSILTINHCNSYHIEAQITSDEEIVFRVFEYGFGNASKKRIMESGKERLIFPRPCILYLDEGKKDRIPDEYELTLEFENQGEFLYKVPVIKLQNISPKELADKKLICLLPFSMLRFRKKLEQVRTPENIAELQNLINYDILSAIHKNEAVGNLSAADAASLRDITEQLYMRMFSKYAELEDYTMKIHDESMELAGDRVEEIEELKKLVAEKNAALAEKSAALAKAQTDNADKDARIAELEALLQSQK